MKESAKDSIQLVYYVFGIIYCVFGIIYYVYAALLWAAQHWFTGGG